MEQIYQRFEIWRAKKMDGDFQLAGILTAQLGRHGLVNGENFRSSYWPDSPYICLPSIMNLFGSILDVNQFRRLEPLDHSDRNLYKAIISINN